MLLAGYDGVGLLSFESGVAGMGMRLKLLAEKHAPRGRKRHVRELKVRSPWSVLGLDFQIEICDMCTAEGERERERERVGSCQQSAVSSQPCSSHITVFAAIVFTPVGGLWSLGVQDARHVT